MTSVNRIERLTVLLQVAELRAERERLLNDKTSLHSQIAELREHYASLGLAPTSNSHLGSLRASQEAESARSEALSRLQSTQLSHERAARKWELEKQQLQVSQHYSCYALYPLNKPVLHARLSNMSAHIASLNLAWHVYIVCN